MRITGGTHRGRRLSAPKTPGIRPTSDRARESVFNLLGQYLTGHTVLDLFAGTGAFGMDALSRGAEWAVFVDNCPEAIALITRNIDLCGFRQRSSVIKSDLSVAIDLGKDRHLPDRFDVIFVDPPYRSGMIPRLCRLIAAGRLLTPGGRVVAETSAGERLPGSIENLVQTRARTYGDTKITIFLYEDE